MYDLKDINELVNVGDILRTLNPIMLLSVNKSPDNPSMYEMTFIQLDSGRVFMLEKNYHESVQISDTFVIK